MKTKNDNKKKHIIIKVLAFVMILFVLVNIAWVRTNYFCALTGRRKVVDRVFFVPVCTTEQETKESRWLDARLGPTQYRLWDACHIRTIIDGFSFANKPITTYVYELFNSQSDVDEQYKTKLLEDLRVARQTNKRSNSGGEF